ncbi:MAG TPA: CAP domain-containing protein [Solirubrobacteraceae bacterium]
MNPASTQRSSASTLLGTAAALGTAATLGIAGMLAIATPQAKANQTSGGVATTLGVVFGGVASPRRPATKRLTRRRRPLHPAKVKHTAAATPPAGSVAPAPASQATPTPQPATPAEPAPLAPCAEADLVPASGNASTVEAATLCLINQVRARHGIGPLVENPKLLRAAVSHDDDMVAQDYFSHLGPAGDTPASRMQAAGYVTASSAGSSLGENIATATPGLATPSAIVASWVASPSHLADILDAKFRDTGIAVVAAAPAVLGSDDAGATYTEDFGVA